MGIHSKIITSPSFPARDIERCIRDTLADQAGSRNVLRPRTTSACEPEIDSLVVVEIICAIEEILGVSLPSSFSPRGGYEDVEACVADLMAETRAVWADVIKEEQHHD
jgi:acyl carrier protein